MVTGNATAVSGLDTTAYQNADGSQVLLVQNGGGSAAQFWVQAGSSGFSAAVDAGAVVTYIWN